MQAKEILCRRPPDRLYHYTTQEGLLGIIERKEIWASHTQYLNDVREFQHAISVLREELASMKGRAEHHEREMLEEMEQGLGGIETINVCVCSFSADDGDALSQWRAYGGGASGFSIGFSGTFLRTISHAVDFWLVPVLYDEEEQRALVRTLIADVQAENVRRRAEPPTEGDDDDLSGQPPGGNLVAYLNRYAPILKHKAFSDEKEWRIVSRPLSCRRERFGYRPGASMLIPYFRIPLASEEQPFRIEEIVVGPTPHPVQSLQSIKGLLTRHGQKNVTVRNSEAPYRTW